jgi:hypothetical protein
MDSDNSPSTSTDVPAIDEDDDLDELGNIEAFDDDEFDDVLEPDDSDEAGVEGNLSDGDYEPDPGDDLALAESAGDPAEDAAGDSAKDSAERTGS